MRRLRLNTVSGHHRLQSGKRKTAIYWHAVCIELKWKLPHRFGNQNNLNDKVRCCALQTMNDQIN